jgi:hypothetical protein
MSQGWKAVYRVGLGVMMHCESKLMAMEFEDVMYVDCV